MILRSPDFLIVFKVAVVLLVFILSLVKKTKGKKKNKGLSSNSWGMTPDEFFRRRNASLGGRGGRHISTAQDYVGVYVLYNESKNMYYVGQAKKVLQRVNAHFTGHGNGDVYADYKYGDSFKIKTISLVESGYSSIDQLERDTITAYNAFSKGYNKTRGNKA